MILPAGKYEVICNIRLNDGDILESEETIVILYSRRGEGDPLKKRFPDDKTFLPYGICLDILKPVKSFIKIIRDRGEHRRYE